MLKVWHLMQVMTIVFVRVHGSLRSEEPSEAKCYFPQQNHYYGVVEIGGDTFKVSKNEQLDLKMDKL